MRNENSMNNLISMNDFHEREFEDMCNDGFKTRFEEFIMADGT